VQVLANFQAAKGDWRAAAAAHLAYARRMQDEGYPSSAVSARLGQPPPHPPSSVVPPPYPAIKQI